MEPVTTQRPLGELFKELAGETATLMRQELELAKVETVAKARAAGKQTAQLAAGAVIAMMGALALLAGVILVLALAIPLWASALIVGLVVTALGGVLGVPAWRALARFDPAPRATLQTLQEDKQWLREQVSR